MTTSHLATAHSHRLLYIDWMRGLAVLFMFEGHLYPAWLAPSEQNTSIFQWTEIVAGYGERN